MATEKALADYDVMSKAFQQEAYGFYEKLQKEAPVYTMPMSI